MSIGHWLGSIDPNLVVGIVSAVGTWLYAKATGKKDVNVTDALGGLLKQEAARIVANPENYARARECLEKAAWSGLERLGVKRSKGIEKLVAAAVEKALGEVMERVIDIQLRGLAESTARIAAKFDELK